MRTLAIWIFLGGLAMGADVIAFTRAGCAPCERFKADHAKTPGLIDPHKLHVMDARSELGQSYGITTVPTFIKLKDGKEVGRKVGYGDAAGLKTWADRP